MRAVDRNYSPWDDEAVFDHLATDAELAAAFPGFAAARTAAAVAVLGNAIADHVEAVAQGRSYRDGATCASYVASGVSAWASDGHAFVLWRDAIWTQAIADQSAIAAGIMALPANASAYIATLPPMVWPS